MKLLIFVCAIILAAQLAEAQILVFAHQGRKIGPMTPELKTFIYDTLYTAKRARDLECEIQVREIREDRQFSDGVKSVDMLEITYFYRSMMNVPEQKAFFAVDRAKITTAHVTSRSAGIVEEIEMESDDILNSRFIFQHNGQGEIISMIYEDDVRNMPCRMKLAR